IEPVHAKDGYSAVLVGADQPLERSASGMGRVVERYAHRSERMARKRQLQSELEKQLAIAAAGAAEKERVGEAAAALEQRLVDAAEREARLKGELSAAASAAASSRSATRPTPYAWPSQAHRLARGQLSVVHTTTRCAPVTACTRSSTRRGAASVRAASPFSTSWAECTVRSWALISTVHLG
ncbi:MAG: hypothetical protein VXW27_10135, partial [Pseudomonadota bacterium]|nr:hypothetical protein [Pseudomonadota bacterium]